MIAAFMGTFERTVLLASSEIANSNEISWFIRFNSRAGWPSVKILGRVLCPFSRYT